MLKGKSLRTKLSIIMLVVSSLTLGTAVLGVVIVDHLAVTMNTVLAERVPLSRRCEEALLAAAQGSIAMHKAREIEDPADIERFADLEGELRKCMIRFDMFVQAMVWGSESETFRQRAGGLTYDEWRRTERTDALVVGQAPYPVQQIAGMADIYFAGFAKYAKEAFKCQKRILRMRLTGNDSGLAISRRLVDLMGGDIGVKSQVGRGSTFDFTAMLGGWGRAAASRQVFSRRGIAGLTRCVMATERLS